MPHVMLDLETMGNSKNAAIVAIGAARFSQQGLLDTFYLAVNLKSSVRGGGMIDPETVMWWLAQSEEARSALLTDEAVLIDVALMQFANWVRKDPLEGMWGNGSDFDNIILEGAYLRANKLPPWSYRQNRCYRTISALHPEMPRDSFKESDSIAHHALHDAKTQAKHAMSILKLT